MSQRKPGLWAWIRQALASDPFLRRWLIVSAALHLAAAYLSVGYHSADEQFQILEFLAYKLGLAPLSELAVEYSERMRPWLQPAIYYVATRAWQILGVENPFIWATSFRLITGAVGFASTVATALLCRHFWFTRERAQRLAILGLCLIWFFPALHVRPSSESLSGSAFLLGYGISILALRVPGSSIAPWALAGACFGVSFEARFQAGFLLIGAASWLLIMGRIGWRRAAWCLAGFTAVFLLGRAVDAWGYQEWVFSPYHYVDYNLIRNKVNDFGRAPWWDVFRMSFTESWPFLGTAVALASVIAWIRWPLHPLTWCYLPFFLVHEAISHKELRFFFPIALAGPVFWVLAWLGRNDGDLPTFRGKLGLAAKAGWIFLLANNFIALGALSVVPFARTVQYYEAVWDRAARTPATFELYTAQEGRDPFEVLGTPIRFYRPKTLRVVRYGNFEELRRKVQTGESFWLFSDHFRLPDEAREIAASCHPDFRTLPAWIERVDFNGWLERVNVWTLYRCGQSGQKS